MKLAPGIADRANKQQRRLLEVFLGHGPIIRSFPAGKGCPMGISKRLTGKQVSEPTMPTVTRDPVQRNLPLEYVRDKTRLDITAYRNIARMVNAHAYAGAEAFAELLGAEPTDQLLHYFHDILTALCILPMMPKLSSPVAGVQKMSAV